MNRTLSNVLLFTAGVVVGSVVSWKIFKSRYELVEDDFSAEDIDEPEEDPDEHEAQDVEIKETPVVNKKPPLKEYVKMVNNLSYAKVEEVDEGDEVVYEPYVISPDSYGEIHAYETLNLNYYADGVLTDELDNPIEDVESIVPADFAEHFGEYEDHVVHIRNDERQCDYEICRDLRPFAEVVGDNPYPLEDE